MTDLTNEQLIERTKTIEAEKQKKAQERLEKKILKEKKKKRELREKLVAPVLLIFTVVLSYILLVLAE